jgi:5'-nucleotidase
MEGFLLGIPSIAMSLAKRTDGHYSTAARVAVELVRRYERDPLRQPMLLNVNVPDIPEAALRGLRVTRLGRRHKAEPVIKSMNPRGDTVYWIGAAGDAEDAGEGTDFHAVTNDYVSVTPLQIDLTRYSQLELVRDWLHADARGSVAVPASAEADDR